MSLFPMNENDRMIQHHFSGGLGVEIIPDEMENGRMSGANIKTNLFGNVGIRSLLYRQVCELTPGMVRALVNINRYALENYRWGGKYVSFSSHAKMHLEEFDLDVLEVIDMLHDTVPCPGKRGFKRSEKEICSKKHGEIFRIILFEDYCYDVQEDCWVVKNVKPT